MAKLAKLDPTAPPLERFNLNVMSLMHANCAKGVICKRHILRQAPCNVSMRLQRNDVLIFFMILTMQHSIIGETLNVFAVIPSVFKSYGVPPQQTPIFTHPAIIWIDSSIFVEV